ncbi:hypothetical protein DOY81_013437 [Sarcophaga bullata]|nr:hypothetical protein DOY81_013437 [Sarcophaga bullata]
MSSKKLVVKSVLNPPIFYMRNFNNWIKFTIDIRIFETYNRRATVWVIQCVSLTCVVAKEGREKQNYAHKFDAEFFACDSTLVALREDLRILRLKLNWCLRESLTQAECMVRNAAECLQPGGFFIATMPDAYEIMKRLRTSKDGRSFGNDVYNIEFVCDTNPPPLFGAKYQFHLEGVVDCPEFLVHFPTLVKLCRKYGLKLERKTTFADYYKENIEKGRNLLKHMNCLDTIYANRIGNDEQYDHIKRYIKGNSGRPYGTLSKSEWEATKWINRTWHCIRL